MLVILLMTGIGLSVEKISANNGFVTFQIFYDQLSPYGDWVYDPVYGYVWIPDAGPGFIPYLTNGYWSYTDCGWAWVSGYPWGWAPFHYGRWSFDPVYGAIWIPGDQWGLAWVVWRRADGCYGWTPMGPDISIRFTFGPEYYVPPDRWIFVRDRDFCRHDVYDYYIDRSHNAGYLRNSTLILNTRRDDIRHGSYITGPGRYEVERASGRSIEPVRIRDYEKPGERLGKDGLAIYRPVIEKNTAKDRHVAPSKVVSYNEIKHKPDNISAERSRSRYSSPSSSGRIRENPVPEKRFSSEAKRQEPPPRNISPSSERKRQPALQNSADYSDRRQKSQDQNYRSRYVQQQGQQSAPNNERFREQRQISQSHNSGALERRSVDRQVHQSNPSPNYQRHEPVNQRATQGGDERRENEPKRK